MSRVRLFSALSGQDRHSAKTSNLRNPTAHYQVKCLLEDPDIGFSPQDGCRQWIAAPLTELDDAIATMTQLMQRAGEAVAGIPIPVEVAAVVRWPQRLGDVRKPNAKGQAMWREIEALVNGGLQQEKRA